MFGTLLKKVECVSTTHFSFAITDKYLINILVSIQIGTVFMYCIL